MSSQSGSSAARGSWVASGLTFFLVGVVFTLTMPDNFAIGITFLALGVVFFSLSATQRAPGDGPQPRDNPDPHAEPESGESPPSSDAGSRDS